MKKASRFPFFVFLTLMGHIVNGQTKRVFLDKRDQITGDSSKATSFAVLEKMDDGKWHSKIYFLKTKIIRSDGIYRDDKIKIADGAFTFYFSDPITFNGSSTRPNISETGFFSDGQKTGVWRTYYPDGEKNEIISYDSGKRQGPYRQFSKGYMLYDGNYADDLRDGVWHVYDENGHIVITDTYLHGKVINTVREKPDTSSTVGTGVVMLADKIETKPNVIILTGSMAFDDKITSGIQNAVPNKDFKILYSQKIREIIESGTTGKMIIEFTVDNKGGVGGLTLYKGTGQRQDVDILNLIPNVCSWKPAQVDNKPAAQRIYCAIFIQNSEVSVNYSPRLNDVIGL